MLDRIFQFNIIQMSISIAEVKEIELKYKNRIIELDKELDFEKEKADQYEAKYRDLMLNTQENQNNIELLQELALREQEISKLRKQILQLNKKLNFSTDDKANQYLKQNEELRQIVEELKTAAISAIMEKDSQIQQLKQNLQDYNLTSRLETLEQKNHILEEELKSLHSEHSKEVQQLNDKLMVERQTFSDKLIQLHKEVNYEENMKHQLIQKTHHLEGDVESLEKVVENYERKLGDLQSMLSLEKVTNAQNAHSQQIKIEDLQEEKKMLEKNEKGLVENFQKVLLAKDKQIEQLKDENEELERKIKIRKRKQKHHSNEKEKSQDSVLASFDEFSKKADMFSSFARRQSIVNPSESFSIPQKLSEIEELSDLQNFTYIDVTYEQYNPETVKNDESTNDQQKYKSECQKLEERIKEYLEEIQKLNNRIESLTKEIQKQREKRLSDEKGSKKVESQLKVQRQSLKLHIFKLQNALLSEKLQNAQNLQTNKQISEYAKRTYEEEIERLKKQLEQALKKKKGFFK